MESQRTHRRTARRRLATGVLAAFGFGLALCGSHRAHAQVSIVREHAPRFEWRGHVAADFRSEFETKSDAGDEFHTWRTGVEGEFGGPINESVLVGFGTRYAYTDFDFNLDGGSPSTFGGTQLPKDPWNSIHTLDFLPNATVLIGQRVALVTTVPIRWAAETGSRRNAFTGGLSALLRVQLNDAITLGAGIGFTSQLEDDLETFPVVSLRWQIDDGLALSTEGSWQQGGRAILTWGPSDSIQLFTSLGYERTRFRLDRNGRAADRNGVGEVTTVPLEIGVRLRLGASAALDFSTGLGIAGRLRVEDDRGRRLYDQQYDPAPRVSIALRVPFGLPPRTP